MMEEYCEWKICGRNSYVTALALDALNKRRGRGDIVFDCRGDGPSEYLGRMGSSWDLNSCPRHIQNGYRARLSEERRACDADQIIVVSQAMAAMLRQRHNAQECKMVVKPCAIDLDAFPPPNRVAVRKKLGIEDRFVVCYLGSLEWYQLPDQSVRIFQLIQRHRPEAFFLGITTKPEAMRTMLVKRGVNESDFCAIRVPSHEVSNYLAAADLGLLLRETNPVNAVASPVKFAEYLACGVPVTLTPGIGDYSELVESEGLGGVIDIALGDEEVASGLGTILQGLSRDRELPLRCRRYAELHLSWGAVTSDIATHSAFRSVEAKQ